MSKSDDRAFSLWRYYKLSNTDYHRAMEKQFPGNLFGLWMVGICFAAFSLISGIMIIIPFMYNMHIVLARRETVIAVIKFIVAIGSVFMALFARHKYRQYQQGKAVNNWLIYVLIISLYTAIILTGIYQSVWSNPDGRAVIFMVFLVVALHLVTASPIFNLTLIISAIVVFVISAAVYKVPSEFIMDMLNLLAVAPIAIVYNWYVNFNRMSVTINEIRLEEERDKYRNESTIDELTQLKNRRNFMQTFQRYLTNPRVGDKFLCFAIIDIDHFKQYNDYYGHLQGDECLRSIGKVLSALQKNGVYAARIGGEEFALLWFAGDKVNINDNISIIHQSIRAMEISHEKSEISQYITVSIGVKVILCSGIGDIQTIYSAADKALYEAKENGRNRTVVFDANEKRYSIPGV
ncbi:MAG: GGDEF domain-containing protein [Defluviitaleaceae bacterium]|nr:GGDEF domain-containing protein [Defluviitaleaceae bacterium]